MVPDILLAAVVLLCACALLWPFLFYPLILGLFSKRPVEHQAGAMPSASLLFAAFNESAAMPAKIANLRVLKNSHPTLEIIAYDDGSSDDTAIQLGAHPDLLTLIHGAG